MRLQAALSPGCSARRVEFRESVRDFLPDPSGIAGNVPSSPGKHTVERLTLNADRTRIRYEVTVTDPVYLSAPATLSQQWDHRPDLPFSPASEVCDDEVAARYRDHVPED